MSASDRATGLTPTGACEHFVQFYEDDNVLLAAVQDYVASALTTGAAAIVIATARHLAVLEKRWSALGLDLQAARARGQYAAHEAEETLARLMLDGRPQARRFTDVIEPAIAAAVACYPRLAVFGELAGLLWEKGQYDAAVELEALWNELASRRGFALFCAYPVSKGGAPDGALRRACREHVLAIPAESYNSLATPTARLTAICELQDKARRLEREAHDRTEIELALVRREQELTDFLENAPQPLHSVGPDGRILWANKAELDLLGYAADEYVGRKIGEFHVEPAVIADILDRVLAGETLRDYPARLRCKDGTIKSVLVCSNALWEDGKLVRTRCFTRDVTAQKRMEATLAERDTMLRIAMRGARTGAWAHNLLDDSAQWSPEFEALFGLAPGSISGTREQLQRFVHPEDRVSLAEKVNVAIDSHTDFLAEFRFLHASGEWRFMEASGAAVYDESGRPLRLYGIGRDTTDSKRADQVRARLAAIVESSDDAIVSKTLDGDITSWNEGAQRLFGYSAEEIIGRSITTIIPPELHREEAEILAKLRRGERIEHFETERVAKDGRRIALSLTVSPMFDSAGRVIGASKVARDISERKRAEEALAASHLELELVAQTTAAMLARCNRDGRFLFVNEAYASRFGLHAEDVVGRHVTEVLGENACASIEPYVRRVLAGERVEFEMLIPYDRIGPRFMHCAYVPETDARSGAASGWIAAVTDITERRRLEDQLRETDQRKDEFLAMLGHELRNPLAPIRTVAEVLRRTSSGNQTHEQMCNILDRQVQQMTRLLDDLLDVSRITQGKIQLHKEPVDLLAVVSRAIETSRPLIDARRHRLSVNLPEEPVRILGDLARLVQMLANILNNAAKYTPESGRISVTVESRGAIVELRVRDNGVGMSRETLPRVFDIFVQAEQSLDRSHGGLGIGLTLVRSIAEQHDGTVEAASDGPGLGSEITVRLPLLDEASAMLKYRSAPVESPRSARKRILIVDDNRDSAESMAILFRLGGHEVLIASDGHAAIHAVESSAPDLILLDIGLPGMNGYEVAQHLRQMGCSARLVAVTGYGQADDQRRAREAGFDHHFVKPVEPHRLERLLV